jgi:lipopolysaccharide transport system permease protein
MTTHISQPGTRREIGWKPTGWAFLDLFLVGFMNFGLLASVVRRDVSARYRGAALGAVWMVGAPLAMVAAYGFVVAGVFGMRTGAGSNVLETVFGLWACLSAWQVFAETANRASGMMFENAALVKRTAFPLALLPISSLLTALVGACVSYALIIVIYVTIAGWPPLTWIALPAAFVPLCLFSLGTSYLLAALGTFVRDVRHAVPLAVQVGMLVSPILYPADKVPSAIGWVSLVNPLTPVFEAIRSAMLGDGLHWSRLVVVTAVAAVYCVSTFHLFRKRAPEFADVV